MKGKILWLVAVLLLAIESKPCLAYFGEICGPTSFTEPSGTIDFPNSGRMSTNSTCYYHIDVGDSNFVSLRFQKFDIPTYLDFCNRAWMIISCVSNEISGILTSKSPKLCGKMKWFSTLKLYDCPVLSLELLYDEQYLSNNVFTLLYEIAPVSVASNSSDASEPAEIIDCGQTFFTNQSGVITLPHHRNITRARINCTYTITTGEPDSLMTSLTLNLTFLDLLTLADELDGCAQDRLQIICTDVDGRDLSSTNCERFSSAFLANPKYSRCLKLEIILQSDNFDPSDTRQIPYDMIVEAITSEEEEDEDNYDYEYHHSRGKDPTCGNSVYAEQVGFVISPHFPLIHPHGLNCTYRIMVGRKNTLGLRFLTFDLEGDSSVGYCSFDWLTISCLLNGTPTTSYSALRKFCGQIKWSSELRYSNCSSVVLNFRSDNSVAKGGFKIQYSITKDSLNFTEIACGRTELNESDGAIILPRNTKGYVTRINCVYTVHANSNSTIALDVKALDWTRIRQQMINCIQFFCEGQKTTNFSSCQFVNGQTNQIQAIGKCQKFRLSLISEYFDYSQEYRIPFRVISPEKFCGNTSFSNPNGAIFLPNVSAPPRLEQNCAYSIAGGINTTIAISLVEPLFQYSYYRSCTDRVTMTCLQSPNFNPYSDKRLCVQMRWPSTIKFFNCSVLMVAFEYGDIANAVKYKLNYNVTRTAENKRTPEYLRELRCELYPLNAILSRSISLPSQLVSQISLVSFNCRHNVAVTAIRKGFISVDFQHIAPVFEHAQDCSQDNVTISCVSDKTTGNINSTTSMTFCGGRMPTALTEFSFTNCSYIQFTLRSRAYYPIQTRALSYRITNDECGNTSFGGSSGNITSPRYPLPYPAGLKCIYNIDVGEKKTITIRSLTFHVQGRYFESFHRTFPSPENDVKFGDDHGNERNYYYSCPSDWLVFRCISNGSMISQNDGFIGQMFCGTKAFGTTVYGCDTLRLEFSSAEVRSTTETGFNIHYDIKRIENSDASCSGDTYFNDSSGTISASGYHQFHPNGMNCSYIITAGKNKSVMLKFLTLSLEHGTHHVLGRTYDHCERDWIQIRCSPRRSGLSDHLEHRKFCGLQQPFTVLLAGCSHVNVTFVSNSTISSHEFQFQYAVFPAGEECGRTEFANATGVITSPAFPSPYPHRSNCTYKIEVGSNNSLSLQFLIFDVGHQQYPTYSRYSRYPCSNDWIKISCVSRDPKDRGPLIMNPYLNSQLCGYKFPFNTTLSRCNRYALEFVSTGSYSKRGFKIQYTVSTMDEKCGSNRFSNASGIITSPGFPLSYAHQLDCTYYIEVGANKTLLLQFLTFSIGTTSYRPNPYQACTTDWVKIMCLSPDSDEPVSTAQNFNRELCGFKYPFNLTLTGCSRAAIKLFVSQGISTGAGFRTRYTISERSFCGYPSPTFTDKNGVIASPELAMDHKPANISCTYFISAQQMSAISLSIFALYRKECDNNWLSIRCLQNDEVFESSLKLCDQRFSYQEVVFPSCSSVQVKYRPKIYETTFFVLYKIKGTEDVCGNSLFTKPSGVISFPKFSPNHATDYNCSYSILTGDYSTILVNLSSFAVVKTSKSCSGDWITISCRNGSRDNTYRITHGECDQLEKRISISLRNCSAAIVVFHSNNVDTGRFFQMSYELVHSTPVTEESALTTALPAITTDLCSIQCPMYPTGTLCKCPDGQSGRTTTGTGEPHVFTTTTNGTVRTEEPVFTDTTNGTANGTLASLRPGRSGSFVGSKSSGVLIACVVLLLLFVASVVVLVVLLRRRKRKRKEDETSLIRDDGGHENFSSRENPAFSPFSADEDYQSDADSYVHLKSMASNLS